MQARLRHSLSDEMSKHMLGAFTVEDMSKIYLFPSLSF